MIPFFCSTVFRTLLLYNYFPSFVLTQIPISSGLRKPILLSVLSGSQREYSIQQSVAFLLRPNHLNNLIMAIQVSARLFDMLSKPHLLNIGLEICYTEHNLVFQGRILLKHCKIGMFHWRDSNLKNFNMRSKYWYWHMPNNDLGIYYISVLQYYKILTIDS